MVAIYWVPWNHSMEFHEIIPLNSMECSTWNDSMYGVSRFHGIFYKKSFHVWNFMELIEIKTNGITWKYSIPFQGGAEWIFLEFQFILFQQLNWNGPLVASLSYISSTQEDMKVYAIFVVVKDHIRNNM